MSIHIRFAEPGDRAQWEVLWRGYQDFYEADLRAGEDRLWERLMHAAGDGPYALVATMNHPHAGCIVNRYSPLLD